MLSVKSSLSIPRGKMNLSHRYGCAVVVAVCEKKTKVVPSRTANVCVDVLIGCSAD